MPYCCGTHASLSVGDRESPTTTPRPRLIKFKEISAAQSLDYGFFNSFLFLSLSFFLYFSLRSSGVNVTKLRREGLIILGLQTRIFEIYDQNNESPHD